MKDQFLIKYRTAPRREFIHAVREQLQIGRRKTFTFPVQLFRPVKIGLLALGIALVITLAFSPQVRAQVSDWISTIGGVYFTETSDYPGGNGPVTILPTTSMSLAEAQATLPFAFDLPSWVPQGSILQPEVNVTQVAGIAITVQIQWEVPGQAEPFLMFLNINQRLDGNPPSWLIGQNSVQEIQINEHTAALVRGAWNPVTESWDFTDLMSLMWEDDGLFYMLSATEGYVSVDDLILTAKSIP